MKIINPTIPNSPAPCIGVDSPNLQSPQSKLDAVDSSLSVTYEWVESLSPELKNAALYRLFKTIEAKPTLVELFAINQVIYRTASGNTFTESAESAAKRTGHDRKTILKGLDQAISQNILEENKRPGTSSEYWFKPVEEWLPQPVVRIKDTHSGKVVQFLTTENYMQSVKTELVHTKDDPEIDPNTVVVSLKEEETTTTLVSVQQSDTQKSGHWKYAGQGLPRVYVPPELDQDTGMKIESIHQATSEPRQFILKEAVELLYNRRNHIPRENQKPTPLAAVAAIVHNPVATPEISDEVMQTLKDAGIYLNVGIASRLWLKYSDRFSDALAYTIAQDEAGKIKHSKEGFFRKSLEDGWSFSKSLEQNEEEKQPASSANSQPRTVDEPSPEDMMLIDDAIATGRAKDKYYGSLGWLIIENNGHAAPWRQFLAMIE